jgi:hypothetical protein
MGHELLGNKLILSGDDTEQRAYVGAHTVLMLGLWIYLP